MRCLLGALSPGVVCECIFSIGIIEADFVYAMTNAQSDRGDEEHLIGPGSPFELIGGVGSLESHRVFRRGPRTLKDLFARFRLSSPNTFIISHRQRLTY